MPLYQNPPLVTVNNDGLAPRLPGPGDTTDFLRADGTWAVPPATSGTPSSGGIAPVQWATLRALPANTYSNGSAGVGATLTGTSNGALQLNNNTVGIDDRIVVNHEATGANCGLYKVGTVGDGSNPYQLIRTTDFDTAAKMIGGLVVPQDNNTLEMADNRMSLWMYKANDTPITVGTDAITFIRSSAGMSSRTTGSMQIFDTNNNALAISIPPYLTSSAAAPVTTQAYVGWGDSYSAGYYADPLTQGFIFLVGNKLNQYFPNTGTIEYGHTGSTTADVIYTGTMAVNISNIPGYGFGSMAFMSFLMSINNLRCPYNASWSVNTGPSCSSGSTLAFVNSNNITQTFKSEVNFILDAFYTAYPNAKIVLCTIPDPSNGGIGPDFEFAGWADYQAVLALYNLRIAEVASERKIPLADLYTYMMGHPEYYDDFAGGLHPTNHGHQVMGDLTWSAFMSIAGGDLRGTFNSPLVKGIQGIPVSSGAPTSGQVLQYNGSQYVPATLDTFSTSVLNKMIWEKSGALVFDQDNTLTMER